MASDNTQPGSAHADIDEDLSPEFAVVREALSWEDFHNRTEGADRLFALILRVSEPEFARWEESVAGAHGAEPMNAIDMPHEWDAGMVAALPEGERLAWLASAVVWLARDYYGWGGDGLQTVAGNDIASPGGLARALVALREKSLDGDAEEQDGPLS